MPSPPRSYGMCIPVISRSDAQRLYSNIVSLALRLPPRARARLLLDQSPHSFSRKAPPREGVLRAERQGALHHQRTRHPQRLLGARVLLPRNGRRVQRRVDQPRQPAGPGPSHEPSPPPLQGGGQELLLSQGVRHARRGDAWRPRGHFSRGDTVWG